MIKGIADAIRDDPATFIMRTGQDLSFSWLTHTSRTFTVMRFDVPGSRVGRPRPEAAFMTDTNDMNDDMVNDLLHTLQAGVAKAAGVAPPQAHEMRTDDPAEEVVPVAVPAPLLGEALEAVITRLLEETPLDNKAWAAW